MKFKLQNIFIYFSALIFTGCGIFNNKTDNSTLISKTDQTKVETKQEISSTAVVSPSQTDQASQATKKQKKKKSVEKIQIKRCAAESAHRKTRFCFRCYTVHIA